MSCRTTAMPTRRCAPIRVEVGELTDAAINHRAAIITLKLVNERAAKARANTQWSVLTPAAT